MSPKSRRRVRPATSRKHNPTRATTTEVENAGRYTRPTRKVQFRPRWHKMVGAASIVVGASLFVVCEFNGFHLHDFGGHIWYVVGVVLAASSIWWFGGFDRPD